MHIETPFNLFGGHLSKHFLNQHGLDFEQLTSTPTEVTLRMNYGGEVMVKAYPQKTGRIGVSVYSHSDDTPGLRSAIRQTRLILAPIFPSLAKYTSDDLADAGIAGMTPRQIDVVNLLVRRKKGRGLLRDGENFVSVTYGAEKYKIKPDGNYTKHTHNDHQNPPTL